ncbi:helix-turn-helix domain-containing protein [Cellulomonas sp. KRMCY2]|uniref:helix-turn-helix domain-containing protein n=1 Tax=Cellulomonas sp. KRMCY2 TaxID=1304865 RepID=UPI00045E6B40|nr:helix-turn-helix domain-containing protein [Cellulomonas sp. KRMCY2]
MAARFLTLADVTEVLNISAAQAYALVRSGELPAIQIGPRAIWRIEATELEAYIQRLYAQSRSRVGGGPGAPAQAVRPRDLGGVDEHQPSDAAHQL